MSEKLSTDPYKGTRDFYPEDMAVQSYIFETWAQVAESFGYERYDASILEPAELYKSKGTENEELVNEQTYTFRDRGDREVTLRPEMTPTAARMVAKRRRELRFPVRWYSIPNLFRYERPQKGRLREHWQLNCDIFGVDELSADAEIILLAYSVLTAFGATDEDFEIRIGSRNALEAELVRRKIPVEHHKQIAGLIDRKGKLDENERLAKLDELGGNFEIAESADVAEVRRMLSEFNVPNVVFDPDIVRGFEYYTGIVFEIFDTNSENRRSIAGGGEYGNLTGLFGGEPITGIGFGMGDVTMHDFLESHGLLTANITAPTLMILTTKPECDLEAQKIAQSFRAAGISTAVDMTDRKIGKKISSAGDALVEHALVFGEDEIHSQKYTLKHLTDSTEESGTLEDLIKALS